MKLFKKLSLSLLFIACLTLTAGITDNANYRPCRSAPAPEKIIADSVRLGLKPEATAPLDSTVGLHPFLLWTPVPDAVYYEIEFLDRPPENPGGVLPSFYRIFASREVFTHGYNPDLASMSAARIFWRVRGLDIDGNPIGVFSDASELRIDPTKKERQMPLITSDFDKDGVADLLYPVFTWVPLLETMSYEVELSRIIPENPNGTTPSRHRIWSAQVSGFSCYDEFPRVQPGLYYYRVRGLTADGSPLGVWSDADEFIVDLGGGAYAATFGDSITHGGGAISYSPSDWEYDYQTYLKFPTYNLGHSGDTSESSAERFSRDVQPFHPRYLLIMTGINSLRAGVEAASVINDLSSIREQCLAMGIRPIFLTLPPINPGAILRTFNEETAPDWQTELLLVNTFIRQQPYYIDLYPHFADAFGELPIRFATDGLHYDIPGKKLMAAIINSEWNRVSR